MYEERMARSSAASIETASPHPGVGRPLSPESAAGVRAGAIAVLAHGVRYLPVVENGTLVGLVRVGAPTLAI